MSTDLLIKGLFAGAFSLAFAWVVFSRYDGEIGSESKSEGGQKYLPLIHGALLPAFLLVLILLGLKFYGTAPTMKMALTMCFDIFLHISLYYVVLIMVLPIFRKYISARACAMLWLLPNYLYITQQSYMEIPKPLFTLHVSSCLIKVLALIWMTGFIAVFGWNIIRHLAFRRMILKNAMPVTDSEVLALFQNELEETVVHKRVYYSGGCAALRRLRKRLPISAWSGENATGGADGFLWRGCATTPARSAGQQGLGKALPNK